MDMFKIDLQLFAEEGEEVKTFTQEDVDRIVQERLARVKKETPEDYSDLKEIEKVLEDFGYQGTTAEKKAAIKAYQEELNKQSELEELQKQAKEEGTSPELLKEIRELKKEVSDLKTERDAKKKEAEKANEADEAWQKQINEFDEAYPDVDVADLANNTKFKKFIKGKGLPLKELYEDFVEFIGQTEAEAIIKVKSKESRSTSSGKGGSSDGGYNLTSKQKELAKENGMTFKEYAEGLQLIRK